VPGRDDREGICPDLVRRVAVGRDPVRADEDRVDLSGRDEVTGGDVGDERVGDAGLRQLPGRESGALKVGPGLVDLDMDGALRVVGGLDDAECGPELAAGEGPGVAVGQEADRSILGSGELGEAEVGQAAVVRRRLLGDLVRLVAKGLGNGHAIG